MRGGEVTHGTKLRTAYLPFSALARGKQWHENAEERLTSICFPCTAACHTRNDWLNQCFFYHYYFFILAFDFFFKRHEIRNVKKSLAL